MDDVTTSEVEKLPPLPKPWQCETAMCPKLYTDEQMHAYALAAIQQDKDRAAEAVAWLCTSSDGKSVAAAADFPTREIYARMGRTIEPLYTRPAQPAEVDAPGRTLYIELDGVMADFDGSFPAVFGLDHRSLADDDMWLHINGHPSFFRDLPPMAGAVEFFRSVEHMNPVILTACPKSNYPHVAAQKRAWVRAHLSATCLVLPVLGGRHKPLFMHQPGDILIDDWGKNCVAWTEAGGVAIKHEADWKSTRAALTAALRLPDEQAGGGA